jgi:hypothetical protein
MVDNERGDNGATSEVICEDSEEKNILTNEKAGN